MMLVNDEALADRLCIRHGVSRNFQNSHIGL